MTILQECTWCGGRIEARMSRIPVDVGQYSVVLTTPVEACTQCTEWYVSAEVMRDIDWRAARAVLSPEFSGVIGGQELTAAWQATGVSRPQFDMLAGAPGAELLTTWGMAAVIPAEVRAMALRALDAVRVGAT